MKSSDLDYFWPPDAISEAARNRTRKRVFKRTKIYLGQRSTHDDIKLFLRTARKDDLMLAIAKDEIDPSSLTPDELKNVFPNEHLSPYELEDVSEEIERIAFRVRLFFEKEDVIMTFNDVCCLQNYNNCQTLNITHGAAAEIINSLHPAVRARVAQILSMNMIDHDMELYDLWDQEVSLYENTEGWTKKEREDVELAEAQVLTREIFDGSGDDEFSWQAKYEYQMLQRLYYDIIHGRLKAPPYADNPPE